MVAAAATRTDFPNDIDQLLLSHAANHAATAFQNARLIQERGKAEAELREARDELEVKVAERTAALEGSRAELAASRARIVTAADETRRRIERDLHDGVQQRLRRARARAAHDGRRDPTRRRAEKPAERTRRPVSLAPSMTSWRSSAAYTRPSSPRAVSPVALTTLAGGPPSRSSSRFASTRGCPRTSRSRPTTSSRKR